MLKLFCIAAICSVICADIYFHTPRGSNNRLKANGRNRRNANRLFDSQNNARGGYNSGSFTNGADGEPAIMTYYQGSTLSFEWTNQHECAGANTNCNMVIQYMCGENVRDGTDANNRRERTIPVRNKDCVGNCDDDFRYGMHEDNMYYRLCTLRERGDYYVAAQELNDQHARYTRQNPGGARFGYECPEEKDYYPYHHPTPWKDIVIMTDQTSDCDQYQANSENVASRSYCKPPQNYLDALKAANPRTNRFPSVPSFNESLCKAKQYLGESFTWETIQPSGQLEAPACIASSKSRDNHNGNGESGYPNTYDWTVNIPDYVEGQKCVFRIRYNTTTGDYDGGPFNNLNEDEIDKIDENLASFVGLDKGDAAERGYVFKNNPRVQPFANSKLKLRLAINTAQFGRTFQDRSHAFKVAERPSAIAAETKIHNVNVRGKRGNIVQVYPAVEYDFVPNDLKVKAGEFVHFQWTGSDTNPRNNAGNGPRGTDRSSLFELRDVPFDEVTRDFSMEEDEEAVDKYGDPSTNFPKYLNESKNFGVDDDSLKIKFAKATDSTYFNHAPIQLNQEGEYNYVSLRNNAFTNRSQKGKLVVSSATTTSDNESYDETEELKNVMKKLEDVEERFVEHIRSFKWENK